MNFKTKLFIILWLAGMAGVLSFLLVDLSALINLLPPTDEEIPLSPVMIKILSVIQPSIILALAVLIGVALASKVGLSAPAAEAFAEGKPVSPVIVPQIIPGLIGGLIGAAAIILSWGLCRPLLPPEFVVKAEALNKLMPFPTRLLYGGITEELLLRWGVMTLLVWAMWRLFQKGKDKPQALWFVCAILISSILFGIGHLPAVFAFQVELTAAVVFYIVFANSVFGLIAGFLYWKKGLEAAIIAHSFAHVLLITAIYFAM
jgi:hypothetical protein